VCCARGASVYLYCESIKSAPYIIVDEYVLAAAESDRIHHFNQQHRFVIFGHADKVNSKSQIFVCGQIKSVIGL
jgi:hypothetical protein